MKITPTSSKSLTKLFAAGFSAAGLLAAISPSAQAADTWLTTGTQDWETGSNWSGGVAPTSADVAFIDTTAGSTYPVITTGTQAALEVWVGSFNGNPSRLDITGGSLAITNWFMIAPDASSNATLNQSGDSTVTVAGGNVFFIGQSGGTGTFNLSDTASLTSAKTLNVGANSTSTGNFNLSGTASLTVNNSVNIGGRGQAGDGTPTGTFNMSGGTFTSTSWFSIGESGAGGIGTFNQTGGTVNAATGAGVITNLGDRDGATGTLNVSAGTFNSTAGGFQVGNHWTGTGTSMGTINVSGTGIVNAGTSSLGLKLGVNSAAVGTVNLDGGTIQTSTVQNGAGTGTFNFNGGTLQATASNATFMTGLTNAFVKSGGAVIDTNGQDVTIDQALLTDTVSTGGGLKKIGAGTLTLTGANTYTGATTINNGTLSLEFTGGILSTTIAFNLTDSTAGQMAILNPGFSFSGTLSLGLAPVTASNSWALFAGAEFDSGDLDSLSAVTSDLGTFINAGGGLWTLSNGSGNWSFNDNTAALSFSAVPEPGTQALVIAGLFYFLIAFRRRRCA